VTETNVEAIRGVYEQWRNGDFTGGVDLFDPHVLFVIRPQFPDAGAYLGLERVAEYTRGLLEPWAKLTIEAEEVTGAGDSVLAAVIQRGVGEESGIATELPYFHLWTFRGGRVIRFESIREREEALEAAGLGR
jgi:ketosteroid isomerase-like protein